MYICELILLKCNQTWVCVYYIIFIAGSRISVTANVSLQVNKCIPGLYVYTVKVCGWIHILHVSVGSPVGRPLCVASKHQGGALFC